MKWNDKKEEERLILYLLGFDDGQIAMLSEPVVGKSGVSSWRVRRGLPPNDPSNNPLNEALSNAPHPLSEGREEFLTRLYDEGLNDLEIAERAGRHKSSIRKWRLRKGLSANAIRGGQPVQRKRDKIQRKAGKKQTAKERELSKRELAKEERAIVEGLPTKEEVYQKVRNSPLGKVTTAQLIREKYGDVGSKRRDTISKLRELVDKDKKLTLDTSGKEIVWIA